jgi:hypothetical protein
MAADVVPCSPAGQIAESRYHHVLELNETNQGHDDSSVLMIFPTSPGERGPFFASPTLSNPGASTTKLPTARGAVGMPEVFARNRRDGFILRDGEK